MSERPYFYSKKDNRDKKAGDLRKQGKYVRCRTYTDQKLSPIHVEDADPQLCQQLMGLDMHWDKLYCAEVR